MKDIKTLGMIVSEEPLKAEIRCAKCGDIYCDGIISSKKYQRGQTIEITCYPLCHKCFEKWIEFGEKNHLKFKDDYWLLYKTFISEKVQFD